MPKLHIILPFWGESIDQWIPLTKGLYVYVALKALQSWHNHGDCLAAIVHCSWFLSLLYWYPLNSLRLLYWYPPPHSGQVTALHLINSSPPGQNGCQFADNSFKRIFTNEKFFISIRIWLKFVPKGPIDNKPALVQVMAWRLTGDKPLPEPMLTQFTDAYMWGERSWRSGTHMVVWIVHLPVMVTQHGPLWI